MSYIQRVMPNTHVGRLQVLTDAFDQKAAVPPAENIFTNGTSNRLDAIKPVYESSMENVKTLEEALGVISTNKGIAFGKLKMGCSHFIQVFNFAVDREEFSKDDRLFYGLDKETGNVPPMITEDDLKAVAHNLITGETNRVAAGGAAMAMPPISLIASLAGTFNTLITDHQTAALALIAGHKKLNDLVPEADKVILKIYDEAEAFYNELEGETQREACRQWGLIYTSIGNETAVTIRVKNAGTSAPYVGVGVKLVQAAGKTLITNAAGEVLFNTRVNGPATIEVYLNPDSVKPDKTVGLKIEEGVPMVLEVLV